MKNEAATKENLGFGQTHLPARTPDPGATGHRRLGLRLVFLVVPHRRGADADLDLGDAEEDVVQRLLRRRATAVQLEAEHSLHLAAALVVRVAAGELHEEPRDEGIVHGRRQRVVHDAVSRVQQLVVGHVVRVPEHELTLGDIS